MVDYKSFHFKEYRIMLPDGESEKVSRVECFRNGDMPTEDNPFKQRWFFSPDQGLAIRLPRNELGERWYRYNDTELRAVCRRLEKENACLAQKTKVKCPIRCEDCKFYDACESKERANGGVKCKRKCEGCYLHMSSTASLEELTGEDDKVNPYTDRLSQEEDPETILIRREAQKECQEAVRKLVSTLSEDDQRLCQYMLEKKTNREIGELFGITESPVRLRKAKLRKIFEEAGMKNFL